MSTTPRFERKYTGDQATAAAAYEADRIQAAAHGWVAIGDRVESDGLTILYEQRSPAAPWTPTVVTTPGIRVSYRGLVIVVAGILAVVGAFLPWITASGAFGITISRNGFDGGGDGIIAAALGILIVLPGVALLTRNGSPKTARSVACLGGVILGALAATDINSVNDRIKSLATGSSSVDATLGTGLILVGFAAGAAIVGVFISDGPSSYTPISQ